MNGVFLLDDVNGRHGTIRMLSARQPPLHMKPRGVGFQSAPIGFAGAAGVGDAAEAKSGTSAVPAIAALTIMFMTDLLLIEPPARLEQPRDPAVGSARLEASGRLAGIRDAGH
jgi:hypothetical protein